MIQCAGESLSSAQVSDFPVRRPVSPLPFAEIRDVREALTLAEAMDCINRREISRAMDVLHSAFLPSSTRNERETVGKKQSAWS